ncbi:MAG: hypothetical protein QNI87_10740 [Erythrobacter sp.]|uniref:hypothetical protein n=1 Tax=Erythrobacter sp. TaxID=1042 RepID=UPI00260DB9ED|nr:hypothetical protein [Erythrobacter sp.]MDJ0978997.1 hypothetical protein [Erythrobacter sp.]
MSSLSRLNPKTGIVDFWTEFRKPNPFRVPMLLASTVPLMVIFYWLSGETHYSAPERPTITYITTFDPERTDEEIIASNEANQEIKDLRKAAQDDVAERKREIYKALGKGIGMDVDKIAAEADARRAAEEAAAAEQRAQRYGRASADSSETGEPPAESTRP